MLFMIHSQCRSSRWLIWSFYSEHKQPQFVWKCLPELRSALGIVPPESPPTVRGGDTSLFSLPGESGVDTPHTSNVSVATSITSVNPFSPRHRAQGVRPQLILQQDGLQMRHTIESFTSLLQKISINCRQLKMLKGCKTSCEATDHAPAPQTYVKACEEMKQNYLQLLGIPKEDLKALMEAFKLELVSPQSSLMTLTREVSEDEDERPLIAEVKPQPRLRASSDNVSQSLSLAMAAMAAARGSTALLSSSQTNNECRRFNQKSEANLFSPTTQDMRSTNGSGDGGKPESRLEDLRRQIGSFDRDEVRGGDDERRDGPPPSDEPREGSEEWKQMYQNVVLAASSIRSGEKK